MLTLGTVREATNTAAATRFVEERVLAGRDWRLVEVRRRAVRLEPPDAYWAVYRVGIERGPDERRELRLVARAVFDSDLWAEYRDRLRSIFGGAPCDPIDGLGNPVIFEDTQHAFWFYPVDPNLLGLPGCVDPTRMRRLLREAGHPVLHRPGRIREVTVTRARYLPEIAAVLRYDIQAEPAAAGRSIYGKVQHSGRSEQSAATMELLWPVAQASDGALRIPQPLGLHPELGLFLQSAVEGEPVGSERTDPVFVPAAHAAARALATIHDSDIEVATELGVEDELARLAIVLEQFVLVHPRAHLMLRDLLDRIGGRLDRAAEEEWLPTHGDLKYDQLLHHEGGFSIIDFDYFGMAETSHDLGKFCAHLVPSAPRGWEDSYAAEEARRVFLQTYVEARPHATLSRFQAYEAINLANRAMTLMWAQTPGWEFAAETMLTLALERLNTPLP